MKILVAIANHGEKNRHYCERLIQNYRTLPHDVDIVVLSDKPKDYGDGVAVRVGAPTDDPWSLPFAHRTLFAEKQDEYDLFIYSEDDTEILQTHIDLFLSCTEVLPADKIAGFLRYETDQNGDVHYCSVHHVYSWDPNSLLRAGGELFARYTNDHAAVFMLTREQLKHCIRSGGFLVEPHAERYDMLVSAATDPYTQCGLEKVICISQFERSSLYHMPNVYLGKIGVPKLEFERQVARLRQLETMDEPRGPLFNVRTQVRSLNASWDKKYYEDLQPELLDAIPREAKAVLSIGCERGLTEGRLVELGHTVTAIPLDAVIAESARMRGIETLSADLVVAFPQLSGRVFNVLLFNDVLAYLPDPPKVVRSFAELLDDDGLVVARFRNIENVSVWRKKWRGEREATELLRSSGYSSVGLHPTSGATLRKWFREAGIGPCRLSYSPDIRKGRMTEAAIGPMRAWLSRNGIAVAPGRQ